jgi:gliding motility-associated-like protein
MKKHLLFLFFISNCLLLTFKSFSQCVSYDVHACIDVVDNLHVQGNQMWWEHHGGSNPGQHSSCSGDVLSVNGTSWGNWSTPFTISGLTTCMTMTSSVTQCSNVCNLIQAPSGSNGWETIYSFDDSGPSAAHNYKITFTYCPIAVAPTATFTVSSPVCAGNDVTFTYTGNGSATATYTWNFTGGTIISGSGKGPYVVNWATPGTYNVSLDVSDCSVSSGANVVPVIVTAPPSSAFTCSAPVCQGVNATVTYTGAASSGATYTWNFDGGTIVSGSGQGPYQISWPTSGTKNVTLKVDENGCVSPITTNPIIVPPAPISTFTAPAGQCLSGNTFSFIAGGDFIPSSTFLWTFGANGLPATSTSQNPSGIIFSTPGYQTVSMTFIKNGCASNTYIDSVLVYPMPVANYSFANVCLHLPMNFNDSSKVVNGTISSWAWTFADNTPLASSQNTSHTYANTGTYTTSLLVTTSVGCKDSITKNVVVHPLPNVSFGTVNVCDGVTTQFTDQSSIPATDTLETWAWDFGDGSFASTRNTSHLYPAPSFHVVHLAVVSNFGCVDSTFKISIVNPNPVVDFTTNDSIGCEPLCISFQNASHILTGTNTHYAWDVGDGSAINNSQTFDHCYTNDSVFSSNTFNIILTVTSDSGCVSTRTKNHYITVYPNPKADFTVQPPTAIITNPVISIKDVSIGTTIWNWSFGDNLTSALENPLQHTYADTGTYTITLLTSNQFACTDTAHQTIVIEPDFVFYIPSAFSPNGDGINDTFSGKGIFISQYEMNIFDRWGNLIFSSNDINISWDGKVNHTNETAKPDVYVYSIKVTDFKSRKHDYRGIVTLVR